MAYINIEKLSYLYPEEKEAALKDINLNIEKGKFIFIAGKSGSGKSTLGKIISGAIPHFYGGTLNGNVRIAGKDLRHISQLDRAREVTMVFQDPERQLMMNKVHREIAFGLENIGVEEKEIKRRVWEALQFVNAVELAYRDINTLSGGQKQRIAIAAAIAYLPKCIILDEPTSQLDPASAEEISALVKKINDELGITIIVIEQRVERWLDMADGIVLIEEGSIGFCGNRRELYQCGRYDSFLPTYLRLAKSLKVAEAPESFKDLREYLNKRIMTSRSFENEIKPKDIECISLKELSVKYDTRKAVDNLNLNIREGEFLGILGANGAGKSTLLKAVMGLNKYEGSLKIYNNEVKKLKLKELVRIMGYVSQNPNDYISKETVYEELKFTLDNFQLKDNGCIDEIMKKLDIYHLKHKNPRDISGGERQRVAIASVMVMSPKVLLLDEPTRGLDIEVKKRLGETLKELNNLGTTIVLVTHDVEFAAEYCSGFVLMFSGEIVAKGNHKEVLTDGIYYTTSVHKLLKNIDNKVFRFCDAVERYKT